MALRTPMLLAVLLSMDWHEEAVVMTVAQACWACKLLSVVADVFCFLSGCGGMGFLPESWVFTDSAILFWAKRWALSLADEQMMGSKGDTEPAFLRFDSLQGQPC